MSTGVGVRHVSRDRTGWEREWKDRLRWNPGDAVWPATASNMAAILHDNNGEPIACVVSLDVHAQHMHAVASESVEQGRLQFRTHAGSCEALRSQVSDESRHCFLTTFSVPARLVSLAESLAFSAIRAAHVSRR